MTIIVALLALLTPVLDQAIYQAELASCGASLKSLGGGVGTYAVDFGRAYPRRPGAEYLKNQPNWVSRRHPDIDDRTVLAPYVHHDLLLCPLDGKGRIDLAPEASDANTYIAADYALYFNWPIQASGVAGSRPMRRLGDAWSWAGMNFRVLAGDWNIEMGSQSSGGRYAAITNHPDADQRLTHSVFQDVPYEGASYVVAPASRTIAFWGGWDPGLMDLNYTYTDGSVESLRHIGFPHDERLDRIPMYANNGTPADQSRVPRR